MPMANFFFLLSYPYIMPAHMICNLTKWTEKEEQEEEKTKINNKNVSIKYSALFAI